MVEDIAVINIFFSDPTVLGNIKIDLNMATAQYFLDKTHQEG